MDIEPNPDEVSQEFLDALDSDPVWQNGEQQRRELRQKFGLPPEPQLKDFPDKAAWSEAWDLDNQNFDKVTGRGARLDKMLALYWSGHFDDGVGTEADFLRVATRLNYEFGKSSLDEVVAEWRRLNHNPEK
jgi:hypothetical protein